MDGVSHSVNVTAASLYEAVAQGLVAIRGCELVALKKAKLEVLVEACGKRLCRREIIELRAARKKPHRRTQELLESILKRLGFL